MNPHTREYHYYDVQIGGYVREYFVGEAAMELSGVLKLVYPVEHGIIDDWIAMEKIWHHLFYQEMRIEPEEHPVAMVYKEMTPWPALEKYAEILFETFQVPALCLVSDGTAALASTGRSAGITVILEDRYSSIVPSARNSTLTDVVMNLDYALRNVYDRLRRLLVQDRKVAEGVLYRRIELMDMIDKLGNVGGRPPSALEKQVTYILPDGEPIRLDDEQTRSFDVYFQPNAPDIGFRSPPIHQAIIQCIEDTVNRWDDEASRRAFLASLDTIPVIGAAARFPGWAGRLTREFHDALPRAWRGDGKEGSMPMPDLSTTRFIVPDRPEEALWRGLSRIARASAGNPKAWITLQEYKDSGPELMRRLAPQEFVGQ